MKGQVESWAEKEDGGMLKESGGRGGSKHEIKNILWFKIIMGIIKYIKIKFEVENVLSSRLY